MQETCLTKNSNDPGEARYFIEEFQNKRKGSEGVKLAECQQMIEKHCGETIPAAAATADSKLNLLDRQVLHLTEVRYEPGGWGGGGGD